jgi:hypothetical protein
MSSQVSSRSFAEHSQFWYARKNAIQQTVTACFGSDCVLFGTFSAKYRPVKRPCTANGMDRSDAPFGLFSDVRGPSRQFVPSTATARARHCAFRGGPPRGARTVRPLAQRRQRGRFLPQPWPLWWLRALEHSRSSTF